MPADASLIAGGAVVGILFGLFGVGGSSFATPVLALLGVPPLLAIASPLPATLPSAISGAISYVRRGDMDWRVARLSVAGGLPGTVLGAVLSRFVEGGALLVASGITLAIVGLRLLRPVSDKRPAAQDRRSRGWMVVAAAGGVGVFTGLLANGGGFLLVPLYLLLLGLPMRTSAGTSLVVIAALTVPTFLSHLALGNIAWRVAVAFAVGSIPAAFLGSRMAQHVSNDRLRVAFGCLLVAFATYFVGAQIVGG